MANVWDDLKKTCSRWDMHDPELTSLAQQQTERINRPELLSVVLDKLFLAHTQERAKQVLMEIDTATDISL